MTYQTIGGPGTQGGFGYYGLGADYPIGAKSEDINAMQRELQRLNFLGAGTQRFGADGYWGPRTASALQGAARYVGYDGNAYAPANADQLRSGEVSVPDDLLDRLRAASPAPPGTPGSVNGQPGDPRVLVEPAPEETFTLVTQTTQTPSNWVPAAVIGGGVLLVGGWMWYSMRPKKRVRANTKRRRRRRR